MRTIKVLIPGPIKFDFVKSGIKYYERRINNFIKCEFLSPKIKGKFKSVQERLKKEAEILKKYLNSKGLLIILDERGKSLNSIEFAKFLNKLLSSSNEITFLLGGADGISQDLKNQAKYSISLSPLTLNHEIALLVLMEAIYRGLLILKNHPYHRE